MNKYIAEANQKTLRDFGLIAGAFFAIVFGFLFPWLFERAIFIWPWIVGGILIVWSLVLPLSLKPVYTVWMKFGLVISRIMNTIILAIIFYFLIFPMGLAMRLFGTDPMVRQLDNSAATYRVISQKSKSKQMEYPF